MGKIIPNVPLWKYYLSFFKEFLLENYSSDQNGHLELFLRKGRLMLCAENAIYSYDDLYLNFLYSFRKIETQFMTQIQSVLVLGMGLGSIPLILEKEYDRNFEFTMVEYDETVAYLAQEYSLERLNSPVQLRIQDAGIFMEINTEKYDMICVDLFKDQLVPPLFKTSGFLSNCRDSLSSNGILIYNSPGNTEEERAISKEFFEDVFLSVFPQGKLLSLHKNSMLFSK